MKASEAKTLAGSDQNIDEEAVAYILNEIYESIKHAAHIGKYQVQVVLSSDISHREANTVLQALVDYGYHIQRSRSDSQHTISWN